MIVRLLTHMALYCHFAGSLINVAAWHLTYIYMHEHITRHRCVSGILRDVALHNVLQPRVTLKKKRHAFRCAFIF